MQIKDGPFDVDLVEMDLLEEFAKEYARMHPDPLTTTLDRAVQRPANE